MNLRRVISFFRHINNSIHLLKSTNALLEKTNSRFIYLLSMNVLISAVKKKK